MPDAYYRPGNAGKNSFATPKKKTVTFEDGSQVDLDPDEYDRYKAHQAAFNKAHPGIDDTSDRSHPKVGGGKLRSK